MGVLAGGGLVLVNFRLLRFILGRAFRDPEHPKPGILVLFVPKFLAIVLVVWLIIKTEYLNMPAFCVGASSLFLAITAGGLGFGPRRDEKRNESE